MSASPSTDPRPSRQIQAAAQELLEAGKTEEAFELFEAALLAVLRRNAELELLLAKLRARMAKKSSSEKLDPNQLNLLLELLTEEEEKPLDLPVEGQMDQALSQELKRERQEAAELAAAADPDKRKRKRRKALKTKGLERRHTHLPIPPQKADWEVIGEKVIERLRFSPAHFYLEVIHQPVLKAPDLSAAGHEAIEVVAAEPTLVPGSMASCDVLAMVLVRKFEEHMPLHRLRRQFLREQKVELPVSTLADWVMAAGNALKRLVPLLTVRVLQSFLVHTDATGIRVLDAKPDKKGAGVHRGTFHAYLGSEGAGAETHEVVFLYTPTGEAKEGPWKVLAGREGYVMADASNSFDRLFNGKVAEAIEVGCHFHGRQKFKACEDDPRAAPPLMWIRRLYRLEELADVKRLDAAGRLAQRQERSAPVMDKLLRYCLRLIRDGTPSDPMRKAAQYYINHWQALSRFLTDGRLPLDNSAVEREFRVVRIGEHNYLFCGSDEAAERMGAILSVVATAKAHGLNLFEYLRDILQQLAYPMSQEQVAELLPHRYKARLDAQRAEDEGEQPA